MPEISREAMIAAGDASTAHSRNATVYSSDDTENSARSPILGTRRLATIIAPTSAAAATADDSATSGAPPPSATMRSERNVNPANTPTCARPTATSTRGSAGWIGSTSRIAPPRRLLLSVARPRSGSPPALTAIATATTTNSRPDGQYPTRP